jgi:hypothetical protein
VRLTKGQPNTNLAELVFSAAKQTHKISNRMLWLDTGLLRLQPFLATSFGVPIFFRTEVVRCIRYGGKALFSYLNEARRNTTEQASLPYTT